MQPVKPIRLTAFFDARGQCPRSGAHLILSLALKWMSVDECSPLPEKGVYTYSYRRPNCQPECQERRDAFELVQKPLGKTTPGFFPEKAGCLTQVALGVWVQGKAHNNSARSFAMTSGPGTGFAAPLSISASRLAAS
jgi:hypothetical protein